MPDFLSFINEILWGSVMIYLLLGCGIWFTWKTGYIQFRYLRQFTKSLRGSLSSRDGGFTSFQILCISLAARVGSGNLAGMALAITIGGPGAVFWMWIAAIIGMASSFAESALAQLYKERDTDGRFRGGPSWYMSRGLGMRWMGIVFSLLLLLAHGLIFNTVQANASALALNYAFNIPHSITGIFIAFIALPVIMRGLKGVAQISQWLVPLMSLLWIVACLAIALWHLVELPAVVEIIIRSAFGWQEAAAGAAGYSVSQAITSGFQRSMFSNEAGMGSTPNAAAAASSFPPHPAAQGIVQMIGVLIDTLIICSASAVVVLLAGHDIHTTSHDGIQIIQQAMNTLLGDWGAGFVAIVMFLFAFTSIIANYVYAENNLFFLGWNKRCHIWLLRLGALSMVIIGSVLNLSFIWQIANVMMALMAIINMTAILLLSPVVRIIAQDYLRQRKLGVIPVFAPNDYPDIAQQLASGSWEQPPNQ